MVLFEKYSSVSGNYPQRSHTPERTSTKRRYRSLFFLFVRQEPWWRDILAATKHANFSRLPEGRFPLDLVISRVNAALRSFSQEAITDINIILHVVDKLVITVSVNRIFFVATSILCGRVDNFLRFGFLIGLTTSTNCVLAQLGPTPIKTLD